MSDPCAAALLDTLLPGGAGFPPASALALDRRMAADPRFAAAVAPVLALLPEDFAGLDGAARTGWVKEAEAADPAAFAVLLTGAYGLYYTAPAVAAVIERLTGHAARPPQPQGYALAPFDPALLAVPAARSALYRPTDGSRDD